MIATSWFQADRGCLTALADESTANALLSSAPGSQRPVVESCVATDVPDPHTECVLVGSRTVRLDMVLSAINGWTVTGVVDLTG